MYRNKKLRDSARGMHCTMRVPGVCNHDKETVVWCHSDLMKHGKGTGIKAHDLFGFYGCSACHEWYGMNYNNSAGDAYFKDAWEWSLTLAINKGLI